MDNDQAGRKKVLTEMRKVVHDFTTPSGQKLRVLDGIDLEVRDHEVLALLGPSGCGKSTILRVLAGLITPTGGEVRHDGKPLTGLNPDVAMVFQSFALCPWMTASENIFAALNACHVPEARRCERTEQVIKLVGLTGFANSYPRELSGGMKQRIGIARAISVDRKLLFMDEPFSQVDALTAESLRSEVLDLWAPVDRNPSSIVMVSHDIKEVVYMADRIVVLGANPGRIRTIVENRLPRPRDYRSLEFARLVDQIHDLITGHEMPDVTTAGPPVGPIGAEPFEPLPDAMPSEIVGLVEYLAARRGQEDVFRIAADTRREFGVIINIVKAAEMLDLVDSPKRQIMLTDIGRRFAAALAEERRKIWQAQLLELRVFKDVTALITRQTGGTLDSEIVMELIVLNMPQENYERQFQHLVSWARFGNLFAYDEVTDVLSVEIASAPAF